MFFAREMQIETDTKFRRKKLAGILSKTFLEFSQNNNFEETVEEALKIKEWIIKIKNRKLKASFFYMILKNYRNYLIANMTTIKFFLPQLRCSLSTSFFTSN